MDDSLRHRARTARAEIESGALRGAALLEVLLSIPFVDRDVWIDELLGIEELPEDVPDLPRESVPYLPTGVEEILAAVREVPITPDDEFVDLGAGLGRVVILAHLLTGARAKGVELQAPLVRSATQRCAQLGLPEISFQHADATRAELEGSIFFLYSPFNGQMMTRALERLEEAARKKPIVVCAVGLEFPGVPWLQARKPGSSPLLTVYDSHMEPS
jgi:predicted RNA methylase